MADEKHAKEEKAPKPEEPSKDGGKDEEKVPKKGKDKEKGEKKEKKEIKIAKKNLNLKPDFRYVVRIANTDIDGTRTVNYGLTAIDGIGIRLASATVSSLGLPASELLGNLSDEQISQLEGAIVNSSKTLPPWLLNRRNDWEMGDSKHLYGTELGMRITDDVNMMKMIRCYKGIRHEGGHKVRGQRTKSNGRTGLTMGVQRKAILAAAKSAKDAEKGGSDKKEAPKETKKEIKKE